MAISVHLWYDDSDKVFLPGIAHPSAKNSDIARNLVFKGFPWDYYFYNVDATISEYVSTTLTFIACVWFLNYQKTTINDARNNLHLSLKENGFELINEQQIVDSMTQDEYGSHISEIVKHLYPNAKTIEMFLTINRGTEDGDQYLRTVHIDYHM